MHTNHKSGFTLVEIMIVVVIIGLLAALAMPAFQRIKEHSEDTRLLNDLRVFSGSMKTFILEQGRYPEDSSSGAIPEGLEEYLKAGLWNEGPSIGGDWDVELNSFGVTSAIGVHRFTVDDTRLLNFDSKYDDGNLDTGSYRKLAGDRFYFIVVE